MIRCPVCRHEEYEGTLFCSECGVQLWPSPAGRREADEPEAGKTPLIGFTGLKTGRMPDGSPRAAGDAPAGPWQVGLRLENQTLRLSGKQEFLLGRIEDGQAVKPDVDLGPFRAAELGVSRLHALLTVSGPAPTITDLGSTNGTRVNGVKIKPNLAEPLRDGDELRLGKLIMRVVFEIVSTG